MRKASKMSSERRRLFYAMGGVCAYCKRLTELPSLLKPHHDLTATVDHIVPLCRGGARKGDNATLACNLCNHLKGNKSLQDWLLYMIEHPRWWITKAGKGPRTRRVQPIPIEHSRYILDHGKKAYRAALEANYFQRS